MFVPLNSSLFHRDLVRCGIDSIKYPACLLLFSPLLAFYLKCFLLPPAAEFHHTGEVWQHGAPWSNPLLQEHVGLDTKCRSHLLALSSVSYSPALAGTTRVAESHRDVFHGAVHPGLPR